MKWKSVDSALVGLFNIAYKSPISTREIFFSDEYIIDCRSIRTTIDYNNSRMPTEDITLARTTLKCCYDELYNSASQMTRLWFLYNYAYHDAFESQLINGISVLCKVNRSIALEALCSVRSNVNASIEKHVNEHSNFNQIEYGIRKSKKTINGYRSELWKIVENILGESGYLTYYENTP